MTQEWYVLRSKPNKEDFLRQQLAGQGIEHFYPCLRIIPVNPRSRKIRPYFPGYMFVHVDLDAVDLPSLQWMPGAVGLVSFDGRAAAVPDGLIAALQQRVKDEIIQLKQDRIFQKGEQVQILAGPFEGYEGIFDTSITGTERVRILIALLKGQALKLDLPVYSIKKTGK